jgi:hypothetical protein
MQAIDNIRDERRRQYETDRMWWEIEQQHELMKAIYHVPSYRVQFSVMIPDDRVIIQDQVITVPESQAYKWIFFNNEVNEKTVQFAINHALQKVYKFIDNYKV